MNAPTRFLELVETVQGDRAQLQALDAELQELHTRLASRQALRDQVAENIEVVEAMVAHARRTFEITMPDPAPEPPTPAAPNGTGPQPVPTVFDQVMKNHPEMQHTAPHAAGDANATVPDAEQPPAGKPVAQQRGRR